MLEVYEAYVNSILYENIISYFVSVNFNIRNNIIYDILFEDIYT